MELGIKGRVFVLFAIDKEGYVTGIKTRGPDKILEKEAARIIGKLPKMTPGRQRGKNVKVPYSVPIMFKLHNN
jgi:protein TonB